MRTQLNYVVVMEGQAQPKFKWKFKLYAFTLPPVKWGGGNVALVNQEII